MSIDLQITKLKRKRRKPFTIKERSRFKLEYLLSIYYDGAQETLNKTASVCPFESLLSISAQVLNVNELSILKNRSTKGSQERELVYGRMLISVYLKNNTKYSLAKIGRLLGGRDHATILSAINKHKAFISVNDNVMVSLTNEFVERINALGCNYDTVMD